MSLLNYFKRRARERPTAAGLSAEQLPTSEDTGLNQPTVDAINSALFTLPTKRKRTVYTPVQRALIGKYANEHGVPKAVKQLSMDFPNLCTKTVIRMQCDYNEEAEKKVEKSLWCLERNGAGLLSFLKLFKLAWKGGCSNSEKLVES